jgi:arylsulfatase A-like enzyme
MGRFASEETLFENCYGIASWTKPAFMSMFTGLWPVVHA